jgi:hypothetical protein
MGLRVSPHAQDGAAVPRGTRVNQRVSKLPGIVIEPPLALPSLARAGACAESAQVALRAGELFAAPAAQRI